MQKVSSNAILKIISTILFLCILAAIILIAQNPSTGYELSIYGAISPLVWALLITAIAGGIGIVVFEALKKEEKRGNWWQIGLSLILLSSVVIVLLPYLRGYAFSDRGDHLSHLGMVKGILQTGGIPSSNLYPPTHLLISQLCSITNISPTTMINFAGPLFYLLLASFTYLLSREILSKPAAILATAASTVLFCYYYIEVFPMGFAFIIFPLVFYLYFKYQKQRAASLGIPLVILIALIILSHMVAGFMLTVALLVMELGKPVFNRLYTRKKGHAHSFSSWVQSTSLSFFLISFIILISWVRRYSAIWGRLVRSGFSWFHLEPTGTPMTQVASESFNILGLSPLGQLELFIKMYGHFFIYAVLCLIPIIVIVRRRAFPGNTDVKSVFLFSCFFLVAAAFWLTDYVRPLTSLTSGRLIWAVTPLFPPLVGLALCRIGNIEPNENKDMIKKALSYNIKLGRAITVGLIIGICSLIGIFSIYPSLFTLRPNPAASYAEVAGEEWLLEQRDIGIKVVGVGTAPLSRFADALWGRQEIDYPKLDRGGVSDHFSYTECQNMGESYAEDRYMSINERGRLLYTELYPQISRLTQEDFAKLKVDPSVDELYTNGEMEVWYVHGQAPEE